MLFRTVNNDDYEAYKNLIQEFRPTNFTQEQFIDILEYIHRIGEIWIGIKENEFVVTATILYEKKFIHNICTLAHVEDVCVHSAHRGKGYGKQILSFLIQQAKKKQCYKITLDCNDSHVQFYEACGLTKRGNQIFEYL
jgi:glucosamine-phosphate N-acetyltransferase